VFQHTTSAHKFVALLLWVSLEGHSMTHNTSVRPCGMLGENVWHVPNCSGDLAHPVASYGSF